MLKLDAGNVLIKPSQRRQMMAWLRRCLRIGNRLGDFFLTLTMRRSGRQVEVRAAVHDTQGDFVCRSRQGDWQSAIRDLARRLSTRLHAHYLQSLAT